MGGGILATVRATRVRSREQLLKAALPRLKALTSEGVTRVEIKSGYGLNLPDEIKMLEAARGTGGCASNPGFYNTACCSCPASGICRQT